MILYVYGSIINSEINVSGDLYISGEIKNCNIKPFHVGGNIICKSIINTKLTCDSNILVSEEITDSIIFAQRDIVLDGIKQLIRGAEIECCSSVTCGSIINSGDIIKETKITLKSVSKEGIEIKRLAGLKIEFEKEIKKLALKYSEAADKRDKGDNSKETGMLIKEVSLKKIKMEKQIEAIGKKILELTQLKSSGQYSLHIAARNVISAGVIITMNNFVKQIKEEIITAAFSLVKNGIVQTSFSAGRIVDDEVSPQIDISKSREQVEPESLRKSIIIEASNQEAALKIASQFMNIPNEKIISSMIFKSENKVKLICVEIKENDNSQEILNKYSPVKIEILNAAEKQSKKNSINKIKVEGNTINECLEIISKKFKFDKDKINYKIVKQGSAGVFGIGKSKFIIEAVIQEN